MTVPLNDRFSGPYETTGGETVLAYDFKIVAATDLAVWRLRDDVAAQLVYGTDYTVDGVGVSTGGNVTLVEPAEADDVYTVEGASPLSRLTDFAGHQAYQAANINAEFDRLQRQVVELEKRLDRALTSSRFSEDEGLELPVFDGSPRALVYRDGALGQATFDEIGEGPAPWTAPVAYAIGLACVTGPPATLVVHDGAGYVCTVAHTASLAAPDPAKFLRVSDGAISGPGGTTVNRVPVYDNTSGTLLAQSPVSIDKTTGDVAGFRDFAASGKRIGTGRISATVDSLKYSWAPTGFGNAEIIDITYPSNGYGIAGIAGGVAGRLIGLRNATTSATGTLRNNVTADAAGSRLQLGHDLLHRPQDLVWLRHNGTDWKLEGRRQNAPSRTIFTSSGTYTPTLGITGVFVTVIGGGGGGGSSHTTATTHGSAGAGGGAGGFSQEWISVASLGATETVTVGAGGAGGASGASNVGANGGSSSFGAHCSATGGNGGAALASGTAIARADGGAGGSGTGGDVNIAGQKGQNATRITAALGSTYCGGGGSSIMGFGQPGVGGLATSFSAGAEAGTGFGAGGSGAININVVATQAGGAGSAGVVIVEEHFA